MYMMRRASAISLMILLSTSGLFGGTSGEASPETRCAGPYEVGPEGIHSRSDGTRAGPNDLGSGSDAPGNESTILVIRDGSKEPGKLLYEVEGSVGPENLGKDEEDWYILEYTPDTTVTFSGTLPSSLPVLITFRFLDAFHDLDMDWVQMDKNVGVTPSMTLPSLEEFGGTVFLCISVDGRDSSSSASPYHYDLSFFGELQDDAGSGADASDDDFGPDIPAMGYRKSITGTIGGSKWDQADIYRISATKGTKMEIQFEPRDVIFPYQRPGLFINGYIMGYNEIDGHWETLADYYAPTYEGLLMSFTPSDHPDHLIGIRVRGPSQNFNFESFTYKIQVRIPGEDPSIWSVSSFAGNNAVLLLWTIKGEISRVKELNIDRTVMRPNGGYDDEGLERIVSLGAEESHFIDGSVCSGHYYYYRLTLVLFNDRNLTYGSSVAFLLDERDRDMDRVLDEIEYKYGFSADNWTDGLEDTDIDGYPNYEEIERSSNPFDASSVPGGLVYHDIEGYLEDRDQDGVPDNWEEEHSLDPLDSSDAKLDPDRDGRSNLEEFKDGTDPHGMVEEKKEGSIIERTFDGPWMRSSIALLILFSLLTLVIFMRSKMSRSKNNSRRDVPVVITRRKGNFPPK